MCQNKRSEYLDQRERERVNYQEDGMRSFIISALGKISLG
jgi:hypothetical protein